MTSGVHGAVDKATSNNAFEHAARAGYSTSGVLHLVVAYIIARLAFGSGGNADPQQKLELARPATTGVRLHDYADLRVMPTSV